MVQTRNLRDSPRGGLVAIEARARRLRPSGPNLIARADPNIWQKSPTGTIAPIDSAPETREGSGDETALHHICPRCESTVTSIRCKLVCPNCHSIVQACCD